MIIDKLFPDLLAQRFDDWLAEPGPMRRADEVAEFYFVHRSAPCSTWCRCQRQRSPLLQGNTSGRSERLLVHSVVVSLDAQHESSNYVPNWSAAAGRTPRLCSGGIGSMHTLSGNLWLAPANRPSR